MSARALAPLRDRDFLKLWVGQFVSVVGDKINQIALAILVYNSTRSMLQTGIMLGVSALPSVLFGVFAGVYVDRWDRRRTMIATDLVRAGLVLSIPVVVRFGIPWVYLIAFAVSTVSLLFEPAKRSLIPDLVPASDLMAANSLDNASSAVAELIGLAFGGLIMTLLDARAAFGIDSLTYVISSLAVFAIAHRSEPKIRPRAGGDLAGVLSEAIDGMRHAVASPVLRSLGPAYSCAAIAVGASITAVHALALRTYDAGATGLAALDAAITVGILLGSFLVARSGPDSRGLKFLWGMTAFALSLGVIAFADNLSIAVVLMVFTGITNMWVYIPMQSIVQTAPSPEMRGRVISLMTSLTRVLYVAGMIGAGAVLENAQAGGLFATIGVVVMIAAGIGWVQRPLREA